MTICGFSATGAQAFVWADAEAYSPSGDPDDEEVRKLRVSRNGIVGVGAGWRVVLEKFAWAIEGLAGASFELALEVGRTVLLSATEQHRKFIAAEGLDLQKTNCAAIVGYDGRRLRGAVLFEEHGFAPREALLWGNPQIREAPESAADVFRIADAQMASMRQQQPRASGLSLTVAKIGPIGVAISKSPMPPAVRT